MKTNGEIKEKIFSGADLEFTVVKKRGRIKQISIPFRLSIVSLYDTLLIPSGAVKRSFFRFLISSAFFPKHFPKKILAPYLPTYHGSIKL